MIDKITQLYDAFMAMPMEGQIITGIGALVTIAALKTIWGMFLPIRWLAASTLRVCAWVMHPRKRRAKDQKVAVAEQMVPFDFSDKKTAQAAYNFYSKPDVVQGLSSEEMEIVSEAIELFNLSKNGRMTAELDRRAVQKKAAKMQQRVIALQKRTLAVAG
ncbi:MAG: hypothetical protein V3T23_08225 [Nitrososphaerales archaeon]